MEVSLLYSNNIHSFRYSDQDHFSLMYIVSNQMHKEEIIKGIHKMKLF